jgi:NADPH:quinone reductase-like Zn-dependent oxidoreductase
MPDPVPGEGEARIRVKAAGVQPFDIGIREGWMRPGPEQFPHQIGQEFSGVVDLVGAGVSGPEPGTPVLGSTMMNGQATHVVVPAGNLVAKPPELSFPAAAALVAAGQTATGALSQLAVTAGDVLLVHAAAGSVGTLAVQLGRLAGATVIGTASPANHAYLRELGALPVPYGDGLVEAVRAVAPGPVTVALDAAGRGAFAASVALGVPRERIGTIADDKSAAEFGTPLVRAPRSPVRLAEVVALAARGVLTMPVRAYPLAQVAEAHAVVQAGHGRGKVVLIVEP